MLAEVQLSALFVVTDIQTEHFLRLKILITVPIVERR